MGASPDTTLAPTLAALSATAMAAALALLPAAPASGPAARSGRIPLPSPADHAALAPNPTTLLGPDRPNEIVNKTPGPIDDDEEVHVAVGADGAVAGVTVDQRLTVHGIGDFSLKIPGPALEVTGPPGANNQPGLRRGSVVWEGFAGGTKQLQAHVTLDPSIETFKLPVAVTVAGGQVRIENRTALPVPVTDGMAPAGVAEAALAAAVGQVAAGRRPVAGQSGIPASLPAVGPTTTTDVPVAAPLRITGSVGPARAGRPGGTFDAVVPGPAAPDGVLTVAAGGPLSFTVTPSLPDLSGVAAAGPRGAAAVRALAVALWQGLLVDDVSSYLGNPAPGTSHTTYTYETAAAAVRRPSPPPPLHPKPFAIGLLVLATVGVLGAGGAVWARS